MKEDNESDRSNWVFFAGGIAVISCLTIFALSFLMRAPLCCADNVYIAVAAKNLANGNGYVSSFPGNAYSFLRMDDPVISNLAFDPGVSTGGPSQLLSVVFQFLMPKNVFAADLAGVATRAIALCGLLWLWPMKNVMGLTLYTLFVWVAVVVGHLSHATLFTGIGDMTSAIFLVLGVVFYLVGYEENRRRLLYASILIFCLAYLTKLSAILYAALFVSGCGAMLALDHAWKRIGELALCGFGVLLLTELALLVSLGPEGYVINKKAIILAIETLGARADLANNVYLPNTYGLYSLAALLMGSLFLLYLLTRHQAGRQAWLMAWSNVSALIYLAYNVDLGNMNPRYFVLPLATVFMLAVYSLTVLIHRKLQSSPIRQGATFYLVGIIAVAAVPVLGEAKLWMFRAALHNSLTDGEKLGDVRAYTAFLDSIEDGPIASWTWQNVVAAEFLTDDPPGQFVSYTRVDRSKRFYILVDKRWTREAAIPEFVHNECKVAFERGHYSIQQCH